MISCTETFKILKKILYNVDNASLAEATAVFITVTILLYFTISFWNKW